MRAVAYLIILFISLSSCHTKPNKHEKPNKKTPIKDGVIKTHHANGKLRAEVPYVNGKKNGLAKDYYSNGKPHLEIPYKDGLREGIVKMYYETGILFSETPYKNNYIDGLQKKYRKNGKLVAEIPFKRGEVCAGLKEYLLDGSLKKEYPTIVVTPVDRILAKDQYILRFSLSKRARGVKFFIGTMKDPCAMDELQFVREVSPGISEIPYLVPRGTFLMEQISIVAKFTTILGNECIIQRKYNLAADHQ